jgi:hypothetical protein
MDLFSSLVDFNFFDLDVKIVAAIIGAAGTMIGALIQLRIAWKQEQAARLKGTPPTKKSRRGPVFAVIVLLLAAGVGGFAFSQYLAIQSADESAALRGELQARLAQLTATADRLEQAQRNGQTGAAARREQRDAESVAISTVGPCRTRALATAEVERPCAETDATRVTLCASVPATAMIAEVNFYARPENAAAPASWAENRVAPGVDAGRVRFADKHFERVDADQTKQVCADFASWDSERRYSARIVVRHFQPAPLSHAAATPQLERVQ